MYPIKDLFRARKFYENILHLKVSRSEADGEYVEYTLPGGDCFAITTLTSGILAAGETSKSVAFEIEGLDQFVDYLKSKDVVFTHEIHTTAFYRIAIIQDPDNNLIMLQEKLKRA